MFADNPLLCYVATIDWRSLLGGRSAEVVIANDPNKFQQKCKISFLLSIAVDSSSNSAVCFFLAIRLSLTGNFFCKILPHHRLGR